MSPDRIAELEAENQRLRAEIERLQPLADLAELDELTGLPNFRAFHRHLHQEVERALRSKAPLSLCFFDIDHFKRINDTHGHLAGNEVLKDLAAVLTERRRMGDVIARYGGEEFAVLLPSTDAGGALRVAERLRLRVQTGPMCVPVTISIGIAICPRDATTPAALIAAADEMLYLAKDSGRNRVRLAQPARRAA